MQNRNNLVPVIAYVLVLREQLVGTFLSQNIPPLLGSS